MFTNRKMDNVISNSHITHLLKNCNLFPCITDYLRCVQLCHRSAGSRPDFKDIHMR